MKVGFSLLVLSYIPDALINIFKVVTDPVMTCSLDILFWLLFFAGLVTVCVGGDIRSRYPRLSATYLFLFGSWGVARLIYRFVSVDLTTGDHSLIWFVDRDNMFLWVDCAYSVARWIVAIAFWISVLKWNYPDDNRPIVNPATQPVVISAVAVTAICAIVLNFILPDVL